MIQVISDTIKKHLFAVSGRKCVTYMTEGVCEIADELEISYDAANELVKDWIHKNMERRP